MCFQLGNLGWSFSLSCHTPCKVSGKNQHSESHVLQLYSSPKPWSRWARPCLGSERLRVLKPTGHLSWKEEIFTHHSTSAQPISHLNSTAHSIFSLSVYWLQILFFIIFYVLVKQSSPDVVPQVVRDCAMQVLVFSVCNGNVLESMLVKNHLIGRSKIHSNLL